MRLDDLDRLVSPIESIRLDVSQINRIMKGAQSTQANIRNSVNKLSTAQALISKGVDRFTAQLGVKTKQNIKDIIGFKQSLTDVISQSFSKINPKSTRLKKFNDKFGIVLTESHLDRLRKAYKGNQWQKFRGKIKTVARDYRQSLKQNTRSIAQGINGVIRQGAQGLKSQLSRQLSFLPDFIKRPLFKRMSSTIDGWAEKLSKTITNSPKLMSAMSKLGDLRKKFGFNLGIAATFTALMVTMFRNVQKAWVEINRTFGGFMLSYDKMLDMTVEFGMKTGQSLRQFKQHTIAAIKQFGGFDKKAVQTGAILSRVFGVSRDERRKLQRIIGGPGKSITKFLDDATKSIVKFGGQGRIVFGTIIRMQDKFRSLTIQQKKDFVDLASVLSSMGVESQKIMQNLMDGFGSIDKALQTTKQANLRLLQMGYNSGQTFKFIRATAAIDIYKRTRVGDLNRAFSVLSKQVGPDFISKFDAIKSAAAKANFLQTMFGDVEAGRKIMDSMRDNLRAFGTTDVERLKAKFRGVFDPKTQRAHLDAFAKQLQRMRSSTDESLRRRAKRAYRGARPQVVADIKARVTTKMSDIKNFQDMAEATKSVTMRLGQMWTAFKSGFMGAFVPFMKRINKRLGGLRTSSIDFFATLGKVVGTLIVWGAKIAAIGVFFVKFIGLLGLVGRVRRRIIKFIAPIGWVIMRFQALFDIMAYWSKAGTWYRKVGLIMAAIVDAILSPLRAIWNFFAKGSKRQWKGFTQIRFGRNAAAGDVVKAQPGGVQRTVAEGGVDQVISPIPMMSRMVDAAVSRGAAANGKLQRLLQQNNKLLNKMIRAMSSTMNVTGDLRLQDDVAHIVSGKIRYRMKG